MVSEETIKMKYQAVFSVKNKEKKKILHVIFCCLNSANYRFSWTKYDFQAIAVIIYDEQHTKRALMQFADNTGPDQPAHWRRLIWAFVVRLHILWIL